MPPALSRVEEASLLLLDASELLRQDPFSAPARKKLIEGSRGRNSHLLSFLNIGMPQVMEDEDLFILQVSLLYHGCWCLCDTKSQDFSRCDVDLVDSEYCNYWRSRSNLNLKVSPNFMNVRFLLQSKYNPHRKYKDHLWLTPMLSEERRLFFKTW